MKVVVDVSVEMADFLRTQECAPEEWGEEMRMLANDIACHVIQVVKSSPSDSEAAE